MISDILNKNKINKKLYSKENSSKLSGYPKQKIGKIINYLNKSGTKFENFLDVGCNPEITKLIAKKLKVNLTGINIFKDGMNGKGKWVVADIEQGLPFKKDEFDLIFCGEIIEHIYDADSFISNINRVLEKNGTLVITTPNLASFWNRVFLLFGYQPHLSGISIKKSYGNPFLKWDHFCGHINLFTCKALVEFLQDNGFVVTAKWGEYIHNDGDSLPKRTLRRITSISPRTAEDVVLVCRKK